MTHIARSAAFDRPFTVRVVNREIFVVSPQAPVELALTAASARTTAARLLAAVDELERRPTPENRF